MLLVEFSILIIRETLWNVSVFWTHKILNDATSHQTRHLLDTIFNRMLGLKTDFLLDLLKRYTVIPRVFIFMNIFNDSILNMRPYHFRQLLLLKVLTRSEEHTSELQ